MTAAIPSWSLADRLRDALRAACHPEPACHPSVPSMTLAMSVPASWVAMAPAVVSGQAATDDVDALVIRMYQEEAVSLVRLARLFVDDRNAAEDLVQEAFIRLARSAGRIRDPQKAAPYLRSIVLNLARDHNRRGLVSLRHQLSIEDRNGITEDDLDLREDQREVIEALRGLPLQQRNCVVLRHYEELGIAEIAETLGISANSVKTHLKRGMAALARQLGDDA